MDIYETESGRGWLAISTTLSQLEVGLRIDLDCGHTDYGYYEMTRDEAIAAAKAILSHFGETL